MKKIKILIVDDNNDFVYTLSEYMKKSNDFEVVAASNGKDGIEKITPQNEPDAIILDHVMPLYDGKYFLLELAKLNLKKKPVIIMSSDYNLAHTSNLLCNLGVTDFIAKPFDYDHITYTIKMLLRNSHEETKELMDYFDSRHRGTLLIKKAIEIVQHNPKLLINVPQIFKLLSKDYFFMGLEQVRWNIDKAILYTWNSHKEDIKRILKIKDGLKPNLTIILDYYLYKNRKI